MNNTIRLAELIKKAKSKMWGKTFHSELERNMFVAEHLLSNGVISLPCRFQQKVYVFPTIENNLPEITEMKCIGFIMSCDGYNANLVTDKNKLYQPCFGDFGKTVFLTKEEAEKALKERGGND